MKEAAELAEVALVKEAAEATGLAEAAEAREGRNTGIGIAGTAGPEITDPKKRGNLHPGKKEWW